MCMCEDVHVAHKCPCLSACIYTLHACNYTTCLRKCPKSFVYTWWALQTDVLVSTHRGRPPNQPPIA